MKPFLSIFLIPLIVLGQAMPHSHAGTGVAEPDDHGSRPHLHVSIGHSHHDHDHVDHSHDHGTGDDEADDCPNAGYTLPVDHDSDAIYIAQNIASHARIVAPLDVDCVQCGDVDTRHWDHRGCLRKFHVVAVPERYARLPIYLLVASLRL